MRERVLPSHIFYYTLLCACLARLAFSNKIHSSREESGERHLPSSPRGSGKNLCPRVWSLTKASLHYTVHVTTLFHTLNLHRVTQINLSVWSLPRISSLQRISTWKYKPTPVKNCVAFGDFTRFNCVLILVHGMWVSPIHLMKKRNTVYSWISWSVITASVKTVGTFWMWVMGERFLFTANNLLIVSHLFVC